MNPYNTIIIILFFLLNSCTTNRHVGADVELVDEIEFNRYNDSSFIDKNIITEIVDPVEPRIKYGQEIGNDSTKTIIIIQKPEIKAELKGFAITKITFDCIDSLHIEDIELRSLQLKDTKDKIVFDYDIFESNKKIKDFDFYKSHLISNIKDLKFWIEKNDKQSSLYFHKQNIVFFRIKIIPCSY